MKGLENIKFQLMPYDQLVIKYIYQIKQPYAGLSQKQLHANFLLNRSSINHHLRLLNAIHSNIWQFPANVGMEKMILDDT